MGANQSADVLDAVNAADATQKDQANQPSAVKVSPTAMREPNAGAGGGGAAPCDSSRPNVLSPQDAGNKLYRYVCTPNGDGNWELASSHARPRFYDAKEDSGTSGKKDFYLEVEQGDVDVRVDAGLNYVLDVKQRRVTFNANNTVFALKFPSDATCRAFGEQLNDALFYNQYGVDNDEDGRSKVMEDYAGLLFNSRATERMFEPMEVRVEGVCWRCAVDASRGRSPSPGSPPPERAPWKRYRGRLSSLFASGPNLYLPPHVQVDEPGGAAGAAATPEAVRERRTKQYTDDAEERISGIVMGAGGA
jgi:hypothetical protein